MPTARKCSPQQEFPGQAMYHHVAPAGGGVAATHLQDRAHRRRRARPDGRVLPALAAGLIALSGSAVGAVAAPSSTPPGLARGHHHLHTLLTPVGPGDDGAEHAAVSVPHSDSASAPVGAVEDSGNGRGDDFEVAIADLDTTIADVGPRRVGHRLVIEADVSAPGTMPITPPVTPPATGGPPPAAAALVVAATAPAPAAPRNVVASRHGTTPLPRLPSVAGPSLPNLPLIPPASLPAPAQFVPTNTGVSIAPVIGLVVCMVALAALLGIRIARRPG